MAIYHKITECPKCEGPLWVVNGLHYKCDKCGHIDRNEAIEILHKKIKKVRDNRVFANYAYFYHVLNSFGA